MSILAVHVSPALQETTTSIAGLPSRLTFLIVSSNVNYIIQSNYQNLSEGHSRLYKTRTKADAKARIKADYRLIAFEIDPLRLYNIMTYIIIII